MVTFLFLLGICQCAFIWYLGRAGENLQKRGRRDQERAASELPAFWPHCAMIIPVAGEHPNMEAALRSLLEQDYPRYTVYLITASTKDAAVDLIRRLQEDYPNVEHIVAGRAEICGQKNYNILAGAAAASEHAEVLVFCDSTHIAARDFLQCLILPIVTGQAAFTTGYHQVAPKVQSVVALGYTMSVLFMRFLQGLSAFTQPWGGALAISRDAFKRYKIADLWKNNVVDDCSLAAYLQSEGIHVRLCPAALLETPVNFHPLSAWRSWLERQILFLKFCMPGQWLALGFLCAFMIIPPLWCAIAVLRGLVGMGGDMNPFLALIWLCIAGFTVNTWTAFLLQPVQPFKWLWAFFCSCAMFAITYLGTIWAKTITWQGIVYHVGKKGVVTGISRQ